MEEIFDDLLRFIIPDADKEYFMARGFEFLEKELSELYPESDKKSSTRHADKLIKVFNRNGKEDWVLVHVEVQGNTSKKAEFSERMFRYFYRILEKHNKPIFAVAIFTGSDAKKMPDRYSYRYRNTQVLYQYHTLSILDYTDEELKKSNNPFASVLLIAKTALLEGKIPENQLLSTKLLIAKELLKRKYPKRKIRAILVFLENYVLFKDPEMNRIFTQGVNILDKNNVMNTIEFVRQQAKEQAKEEAKGMLEFVKQQAKEEAKGMLEFVKQQAKEEAKKEAKEALRSIVLKLLTLSSFSNEQIAEISGTSLSFVEETKSSIKK